MAFEGFGKNTGPIAPPKSQTPFGNPSPPPSTFPPSSRPTETLPKWGYGQKYIYHDYDAQPHQQSPEVVPPLASAYAESAFSASSRASQVQDLRRTGPPTSFSSHAELLGASKTMRGSCSDLIFGDQGSFVSQKNQSSPLFQNESPLVPKSTRSPPLVFQNNLHTDGETPPLGEAQLPFLPLHMRGNSSQSFQNFPIRLPQQWLPSIPTNNDPGRQIPVKHTDQVSKRTRSPPHSPPNGASFEKSALGLRESKRPSTSPSKLRSNGPPDSLAPQKSSMSGYGVNVEVDMSKPMDFPVPKRTKFPSVPSSDQVLQYDSNHADDDIQRETEAKAKRLARFKVDLSQQNVRDDSGIHQRGPSKSQYQSVVDRPKFSAEDSVDSTDDFSDGNLLSDYQGLESSGVIIGSCPDMCPESERAERERKGDLDQYERLDGDRHRTSKLRAVKKYTRTAERQALLIRPMPILQKTMDYLLNLLEQPYGESFLGLYNFLWDRMRAIRMDLRMQHIFNREAINMLEQMIRLHIIAMHELCEYTRGEGFSEGFDAHLNIEQMNKTSVELFQLYDDHRKRGISVETEREFRGYYALLKLDKHPGYKVEPAELSLDLAKMTPDMRQTPEVLFARDVARACRTGNFIAFFRLARRASYLQACLMHAHFSKLRTQALASLHSGLQNGQGIPVAQVAKWLGMEEEDIEDLLEYYGFSLKEFEEAYMVKEGPFLEVDNDYPVKCSKLVHKKKLRTIFDDVSVPHVKSLSGKETESLLDKDYQQKPTTVQFLKPDGSSLSIEEDMPDYETVSSPKDEIKAIPITKTEFHQKMIRYESLQAPPNHAVSSLLAPPSSSVLFPHISPEVQQQAGVESAEKPEVQLQARVGNSGKPKTDEVAQFDARSMPIQFIPTRDEQESSPALPANSLVEDTELNHMFDEENEDEELVITTEEAETNEPAASYYHEEVAEAKLKLIIRIWKRRSTKKREMREEKQLASKAALSFLSLGVPMWSNRIQHSTSVEFNIDRAVSKWYQTRERSWSRLNVSDVVATTLHEKNAAARCLCWKVIICCQDNINTLNPKNGMDQLNAKSWLLSKLIPAKDDEDDTLIVSPGLSVWRNWLLNQSGGDLICCLSVIKYADFENLNETVAGASAILFLLSEGISWDLQKNQLHKLLMCVPSGSQLPLLIVSGLCKENADPSTIVKELELHEVHESRLHSFTVVYLKSQQTEQLNGFFSDEQLRGGLKWLASESPPQPVLQCVKARELVLYHLNSLLGVLGEMNAYDVGPNNCISAFNEALDHSMREIAAAAHANPTCWPCPEIALLEEYGHEHEAVTRHLPKLGWSLAPRIEPVVHAICDCKFPFFPDDTSWLHRSSDVDVKSQILQLQNCLIKYFTDISKLMELPLAEKEASVVMQKFVQLQLQNSHYYIVPNWVMIFQRAFNWQLMRLAKETSFSVYIMMKHDFSTSMLEAVELEDSAQSHYHLSHPSLDEMVEAGRMPLLGCAMSDGEGRAFQPYPGMISHSEEIPTAAGAVDETEYGKDVGHVEFVKASYNTMKDLNECQSEPLVSIKEMKETAKLGKLLERCKIKQSMIEKNLSVYF
ncbi:SAC3 family protein B isoform X2 [Capsicum annuum]|uniref:SAC3 family protein B isoform X2 n=1 Tax=Capsicum annuum TaxID=4072 RepID=UPI001FB122AF|nr:SAC3 family protein B isoform X2 [Capsicum annuum]